MHFAKYASSISMILRVKPIFRGFAVFDAILVQAFDRTSRIDRLRYMHKEPV